MAKSPRLNDLQLVVLANALKRDDGSVIPLPESLACNEEHDRVSKGIESLLKLQLVAEQPITKRSQVWRTEGEEPIGLFLTKAGRKAIEPDADEAPTPPIADPAKPLNLSNGTPKIDQVIALLRRPEGATMNELTSATGWLPHSARAVLTGLRKKGHDITRGKRGEATCYSIQVAR